MLWVLKRTVSFGYPKHMLKLMRNKIFTILPSKFCLSRPMLLILQSILNHESCHTKRNGFLLIYLQVYVFLQVCY